MAIASDSHSTFIIFISTIALLGVSWILGFIYTWRIAKKIKSYNSTVYQAIFPQGWYYQIFIYRPSFFFGSFYFFQFRPVINQLQINPDPILQHEGKRLKAAYLMYRIPFILEIIVVIAIGILGFSGK